MTGLVLALATLSAGDGGPRSLGASEPVAVSLAGCWEGTWENCLSGTSRVDLRGGVLRTFRSDGAVTHTDRLVLDGRGAARLESAAGTTLLGVYRLEGRRLVVRLVYRDGRPPPRWTRSHRDCFLVTLRPARP
jgi:hypothetical protein